MKASVFLRFPIVAPNILCHAFLAALPWHSAPHSLLEKATMSSAGRCSWFNVLARTWSPRQSAKTILIRRPRRAQLEVGQLEDRQLLSTLTALASFTGTNGANPIGGLIQ